VDEKQADWCRKLIARQVSVMARLLDDLLDLSRISQGGLVLRPEPVQVWTLLGAAIETSRPIIDARRHELVLRMPEDPVRLTVDRVRITQVISNLLNNAAQYTPEGGRIELHARVEPEGVVIEISDNGIGLAADEHDKIFDMFTQIGERHEVEGGLGIGLTLVRHLVELHKGTVEARSAGVGLGSTFRVWLPRSPGTAPAPAESGPLRSKVEPRRAIVADDKHDVADSLAMLLRLDGHDVRVAYSGPEALQLARTFPADVAILDIGMPGMDGYTLAREWPAMAGCARTFLVALTGWGSSADKKKAADAGFARHLTKPVSPEQLAEVMRECRSRAG
jgi:CheY-like chemotaxis protein/anti-sigma regulatory factor (Ser/Thr protein kinase)